MTEAERPSIVIDANDLTLDDIRHALAGPVTLDIAAAMLWSMSSSPPASRSMASTPASASSPRRALPTPI